MYSKRVQIDAGIDLQFALSRLDQFVKLYADRAGYERNKPVFFGDEVNMIVIYQTDKSYIIRKG